MMKISRNELKSIIKECLVEIFAETATISEGISNKKRSMNESSKRDIFPAAKKNFNQQQSAQQQRQQQQYNQMNSVVESVAGGDPIMQSILSDTAKNTLPAMIAGGDSMSPIANDMQVTQAAKEHFTGDPTEIFSESAMNWEKLAFSSKKL
jgi:hypothetical protein